MKLNKEQSHYWIFLHANAGNHHVCVCVCVHVRARIVTRGRNLNEDPFGESKIKTYVLKSMRKKKVGGDNDFGKGNEKKKGKFWK